MTCHFPGAHDTFEQINEGFCWIRATGAPGERGSNLCCQIASRALVNLSPCNSFVWFYPGFPIHLSIPLFHFKVIDACSFTLIMCVSCWRLWSECPPELGKCHLYEPGNYLLHQTTSGWTESWTFPLCTFPPRMPFFVSFLPLLDKHSEVNLFSPPSSPRLLKINTRPARTNGNEYIVWKANEVV